MPSEQYKRVRDWINYNSRNDSLVVNNYKTTDALIDLAKLEKIAHAPEVISGMPVADTSMPILPRITNYQCLIKERDEAVQLLTKVCEYVTLDQIDGLVEWWLKRKPKSEREQKLDKIASALSLDGKPNDDFRKVAERVLQALGE